MDILDIDEALKDDSFICLEDKTHDDVSNILQQWKSNNCLLPAQYQHEQAYKLNSRTFTRPRRKSTQNLEQHFAHSSANNGLQTALPIHHEQLQQKFAIATPQPVFNLEIGGLVTTMHKSFLQDTSPPSSICSSMEMSMERMNNSLITSADFSNINFLQSTQSLDFNEPTLNGSELFNLANKATCDGYTLSDMIRDRKALESLTLSGDGTLIKDSHIGQIDDISLAFSKTASGYSTMDNSTESMQEDQQQQQQQRNGITAPKNATTVGVVGNSAPESKCNIMHRTMLLSDDVISDTTFELVESSLCDNNINGNDIAALSMTAKIANETFKRPWTMDETVCIPNRANVTYEFKQLTPDARLAAETRCETPENMAETLAARKFYESTPHAAGLNAGVQPNTPTTSKLSVDEVNLSPIVGATEQLNATRVLSETFGQESNIKKMTSKTFSGTLPRLESIEQMLEDIENPNETYEKPVAKTQVLQQSAADIQMQNVLELAHAEEELLASNNDQEFEDMLEEFSKVEVNAEHVKMKKSLETIKKRFNRDHTTALTKATTLQQAQAIDDFIDKPNEMHLYDAYEKRLNGSYNKADATVSVLSDCTAPIGLSSPSPSSASISVSSAASSMAPSGVGNVSGTGERLLSRRSRLYDNINLSTISAGSNTQSPSRSLGASFTVHKRDDSVEDSCAATAADRIEKQETEYKNEQQVNHLGKTEGTIENQQQPTAVTNYSNVGTYKLSERRERDRDRFKTIKIVKARNTSDDLVAVNVPCIDDDDDVSLCADDGTTVFNNNKSEIENECKIKASTDSQSTVTRSINTTKINPNFLTYKKPKDKPTTVANLPEIVSSAPLTNAIANTCSEECIDNPPEPASRLRSRSRPRYITGLQKMTVVKATSAGDLDRATAHGIRPPTASVSHAALDTSQHVNATIIVAPTNKYSRNSQPIKTTTTTTAEVKSPMGTKSKSFHNLSSNFGFNGGTGVPAPRASHFGLKKPTVYESAGAAAHANNDRFANGLSANSTLPQQADDAVFKVPKLVSGLRAPGVKRAGLVRPSSAYYSLNSLSAKGMPPLPQPTLVNDTDSDGGRHSPTDSMSSASSRGSIQNGGSIAGKPNSTNAATTKSTTINTINANTLNLTKFTTGSKGIPKPSGLRPPTTTNIKRSGLPKPVTSTGLTRR